MSFVPIPLNRIKNILPFLDILGYYYRQYAHEDLKKY